MAIKRRRSFHRRGPRRPVRWIYGGSETMKATSQPDPPFVDECAIRGEVLVCNPDEGVTGYELVNGETDLEYADKAESTICRVVGDVVFRAGFQQLSMLDFDNVLSVPPMWRIGLIMMRNLKVQEAQIQAPDIWERDANQDADWMYRAQHDFAEGGNVYVAANSGGGGDDHTLIESCVRTHLDVRVNRKCGREDSLILVAQMGWFNPFDITIPEQAKPRVIMFQDLRVLVKN